MNRHTKKKTTNIPQKSKGKLNKEKNKKEKLEELYIKRKVHRDLRETSATGMSRIFNKTM